MPVVLWGTLGLLAYSYVLYPALVVALSRLRRRRGAVAIRTGAELPFVTVIVAAHNEEASIGERIGNLLQLDYPRDRFEIVIASDGSTDRTVDIARSYSGSRVRTMAFPENRGRPQTHDDAVRATHGEVLVFSDAETQFAADFLRRVVDELADPLVGCGAGEYSFRASGDIGESEATYWGFERAVRRAEAKLGILAYASGGCFVIRRELYQRVPLHLDIDDFLTYRVLVRGYRLFYAEAAKAYDVTVSSSREHFQKRIRTALKAAQGLFGQLPALIVRGRLLLVWALLSHRVIRWSGGVLLPAALFSAAWSVRGGWQYGLLFTMQALFYALAVVGWRMERRARPQGGGIGRTAALAYSFVLANAAFLVATVHLVRGERILRYRPMSHYRRGMM